MQPFKNLKINLNRHILELLDGPKNARNGPEPVKQLIYLHKRSKNLHLNFSTKTQPINKLRIDPNRYILRLLDESKNASSDPQLNCSTRTQPINKRELNPSRYVLELSDEPKNTVNGSEPVKKWIYLIHPSYRRDKKPTIEFLHKDSTY